MIIARLDFNLSSRASELVCILDQVYQNLFESTLIPHKPVWKCLAEDLQLVTNQTTLVGHLKLVDGLERDADILGDCLLFKHFCNKAKGFLWVKNAFLKRKHTFVNHTDIKQILSESLHEVQLTDNNLAAFGYKLGVLVPLETEDLLQDLFGNDYH